MNSVSNVESAKNIGYNNTTSGLTATDVQGAIDEVGSLLFPDFSNVLKTTSQLCGTSTTTTQDCYLIGNIYSNSSFGQVAVDGVKIAEVGNNVINNSTWETCVSIPLKKVQ